MRSQRDVCLITDSENEDRQKIINVDIGRSDLFRTATIVKGLIMLFCQNLHVRIAQFPYISFFSK